MLDIAALDAPPKEDLGGDKDVRALACRFEFVELSGECVRCDVGQGSFEAEAGKFELVAIDRASPSVLRFVFEKEFDGAHE